MDLTKRSHTSHKLFVELALNVPLHGLSLVLRREAQQRQEEEGEVRVGQIGGVSTSRTGFGPYR